MNFLATGKYTTCCTILCNKSNHILFKYPLLSLVPGKKKTRINITPPTPSPTCFQFISNLIQVRYKNKCDAKFHVDVQPPSFDYYRKPEFKYPNATKWGSGDEKPGATYVVAFFGLMTAAYGTKTIVTKLVLSMSTPADVLALSTIDINLTKISPGECLSFKWRGKPLFVKNRTPAEIDAEANTPMSQLRDPETPEQRTVKPEWLIVIGICTHLGCVPIPNTGDWAGGFYCPCHGSHYDNVGRARKGPAPLNLEVPPYKFIEDDTILVG